MSTCTICGEFDDSNAAAARYHQCGADHLRTQNIKYREVLEKIGEVASNPKLPHNEIVEHVLAMIGKKR